MYINGLVTSWIISKLFCKLSGLNVCSEPPPTARLPFAQRNTRTDGQGTEYQPQDTVKNLTTVNHATVKLYARWKWYDSVGHLTIDELKNYPCDITLLVDMPYLLAEFIRVVFQFIDG